MTGDEIFIVGIILLIIALLMAGFFVLGYYIGKFRTLCKRIDLYPGTINFISSNEQPSDSSLAK